MSFISDAIDTIKRIPMTEETTSKNSIEDNKVDNIKQESIKKALSDPTKKRKAEDEIEIDLNQSVPLSKKQKRLLRRGKVTLEELNEKFNLDPSSVEEYKKELVEKEKGKSDDDTPANEEETTNSKKPRSDRKFGVWIGNLSFDTTKEDLCRFIIAKTRELEDGKIEESDILRINLPLAQNDGKQVRNKGFAHMNFKTEEQMQAVIGLSESQLNSRNLLIKNASSFDGRPDKNDLVLMSKNPPSRILFVGNLSFDTTEEVLRKHFQHCGEIVKVRMATFQDSGKCKGFSFVDFRNEEGPTNALRDKSCRKLAGRPLRMEFGEDRSKRQVKRKEVAPRPQKTISESIDAPVPIRERKPITRPKKTSYTDSNNRLKSSVALANAPRASAAIVPSKGKKITFN